MPVSRSIEGISILPRLSMMSPLVAIAFNVSEICNLLSLSSSAKRSIFILKILRPAGCMQCDRKKRTMRCSGFCGTLAHIGLFCF